MQPVEVSPELEAAIASVARERRGFAVARDTHYDAFNIELRWRSWNCMHRIDFQPYPEGHVAVTLLLDVFPAAGRLLNLARRIIPMFPNLVKTQATSLGILEAPFDFERLRAEINGYLVMAAMGSMERTCRVEIVTKGNGALPPETTGLSVLIQAARVVVNLDGESRSHVVVRSGEPPWQLPTDDILVNLFPADVVSSVRAELDGLATLSCTSTDPLTMFSAASAAATVKRSWGWDESPTIAVKFTSGESFTVDPIPDGGAWIVIGHAGIQPTVAADGS